MQSKNMHNQLYKLAIAMHKLNGRGVKHNLELLQDLMQVRDNNHKNRTR